MIEPLIITIINRTSERIRIKGAIPRALRGREVTRGTVGEEY